MTTVPPTRSAVDALAVASTMSPSDRATVDGSSSLPVNLSLFVDTWVSAPHRPEPIARDFTFKAVIGEPEW